MLTISRLPATPCCATVIAWPGMSPPLATDERMRHKRHARPKGLNPYATGTRAQSRRESQVALMRAPRNQFVPLIGCIFSIPKPRFL